MLAAAVIGAVLLQACGGSGSPSAPAPTATLRGVVHVIPTGPPIAGVTVTVHGTSVVTPADGTFTFSGLPTGATSVTLVKAGYVNGNLQVTLAAGDNFYSLGMSASQ